MKLFLSTADASGDLHGAALVAALRERVPDLEVTGLGGDALRAAGMTPVVEQSELAVAGLLEIASSVPAILRAFLSLRRSLRTDRPDLVVLVDSPDLNLRLAPIAKRAGIPVLYYIAPQVWAWRSGRVRQLQRSTDRVGVIFPFEEGFLRRAGVNASFVGHPLVDRMADVRKSLRPEVVARELELDLVRPVLGLLPGSRRNEFAENLPCFLETSRIVHEAEPRVQIRLIVAPTIDSKSLDLPDYVKPVEGHSHEMIALSTCVIAAPGTVTVEAALLGTPMVVTHRVNPLSFELARRLARVPSSCMVNLLAGSGVVPERIQWQSRPAALVPLVLKLLRDEDTRQQMQLELAKVSAQLGERGAADRAADLALEVAGRG
ncbi:MAG: lipid-A-disaccharide synthase [bacterium]|nr:lipid-A-disaccharide synthase [bacterium]